MRSRTRRAAAVLLAVTAGCVTGCGSSHVSKQDFIARANGICENAIRAVRNIAASSVAGSVTLPALAHYLNAVTPIVESEAKQLRELPRPTTDRALLDRYLASVQTAAVQYRALAASARAEDRTAINAATAALQASPAAILAGRYGITTCAEPTGTGPGS